jgi:hypothetical protein
MRFLQISLIILVTALFGCETNVNIPFPDHEPRLVVYGFLEPDSIVKVYISRSTGINENVQFSELLIQDAEVALFANGVFIENLAFRDSTFPISRILSFFGDTVTFVAGRYESQYLVPKAPTSFEIRVKHPDYETAIGTVQSFNPPVVDSVRLVQRFVSYTDPLNPGSTFFYSLLSLRLQDNGNEANGYSFRLKGAFLTPQTGDTLYTWDSFLTPAVLGASGYEFASDSYILDTAWNGRSIRLDFLLNLENYLGSTPNDTVDWNEFTIEANALSQEEVEFDRKRGLQQNSGGFDFFPPEPVVVRGNVVGGYGFLSARRSSQLMVRR